MTTTSSSIRRRQCPVTQRPAGAFSTRSSNLDGEVCCVSASTASTASATIAFGTKWGGRRLPRRPNASKCRRRTGPTSVKCSEIETWQRTTPGTPSSPTLPAARFLRARGPSTSSSMAWIRRSSRAREGSTTQKPGKAAGSQSCATWPSSATVWWSG